MLPNTHREERYERLCRLYCNPQLLAVAQDVQFYSNREFLSRISEKFPEPVRDAFAWRTTNWAGVYSRGKTTNLRAAMLHLQSEGVKVGFVPEVTVGRELRPGEVPGEFVYPMEREEFHRERRNGNMLVAYWRGRGTHRYKLGGIWLPLVEKALAEYDVLFMNINSAALYWMKSHFAPFLASVVVVTDEEAHGMMQFMRNVPSNDSEGMNPLGVRGDFPVLSQEELPDVLWWENELHPEAQGFADERVRQEYLIGLLSQRFNEPLKPLEHGNFPLELPARLLPRTRGEYLRMLVMRGEHCMPSHVLREPPVWGASEPYDIQMAA